MYKKNAVIYIVIFLFGTILPINASSQTPTLHKFAGLEFGYATFSFAEKLDHKLVFPVANLTAGLAYQRFSLVINASGSIADADVSEEGEYGKASHHDIDLTLAYQLDKISSIFIGFKDGRTEQTLILRDETLTGGGPEYYNRKGPYVGININWAIPDAGKFSFSLAYADLDADNSFAMDGDGVTAGEVLEFDDLTDKVTGKSDGFSYAISWTMPIKENLIYRTKLKVNEYQQDINHEGKLFKNINESSTMLLVGVTAIF